MQSALYWALGGLHRMLWTSFANPAQECRGGLLVNIVLITNRRTQEFKVAAHFAGTIGNTKERIRELHVKPSQVDSTNCNKVAFTQSG